MTVVLLTAQSRRRPDKEGVIARTTRLLALTTALTDANTTEAVADVVLEAGLGVVEAARGCLALAVGRRLSVVSARGYGEESRARVMNVNETSPLPLRDAALSGEAVWLATADEHQARYPWASEHGDAVSGTEAHFAVPLIHRGVVLGGLGLSFPTPTSFGAADRAFTLCLGQVVAAALHRARSYDEERERRQQAERMAAARADVLGVVAHDLGNPLNVIDMTAQFLLDVDPPLERRRELLNGTRRAAAQMNRLVGDLLDAVRMQAGSLRLHLGDVDIGAALRSTEELHRALAERNGIDLRVELPKLPLCARGDEMRVVQALGNLLGNALKFTPPGGRVSLSAGASDSEVAFRVTDTGPGIPDAQIGRVFDRFWQAREGARDGVGVGLGLAIVKGIAEAHGGRAWVESAVGVGSTFVFTVPRCPQAC